VVSSVVVRNTSAQFPESTRASGTCRSGRTGGLSAHRAQCASTRSLPTPSLDARAATRGPARSPASRAASRVRKRMAEIAAVYEAAPRTAINMVACVRRPRVVTPLRSQSPRTRARTPAVCTPAAP
jgi:hypothetical protein